MHHPPSQSPCRSPIRSQPNPGMQPLGIERPMAQHHHSRPPVVWMTAQPPIPGVPPGLEYLSTIDYIYVHQLLELFEILTGIETTNRYICMNGLGQRVFYAFEQPNWNCQGCSQGRAFTIRIVDNFGREVMRVRNPADDCCSARAYVEAPPGNLIGSIAQTSACGYPTFVICNARGQVELLIDSPAFFSGMTKSFKVYTVARERVGVIQKQWSGTMRELFSDADNFGVKFPLLMDVHLKALLLGATFLIDFLVFEENGHSMYVHNVRYCD